MPGPDVEPAADQVVEQMRAATDRLRGQAWMVAPMTSQVEPIAATEPARPS